MKLDVMSRQMRPHWYYRDEFSAKDVVTLNDERILLPKNVATTTRMIRGHREREAMSKVLFVRARRNRVTHVNISIVPM